MIPSNSQKDKNRKLECVANNNFEDLPEKKKKKDSCYVLSSLVLHAP